MAKALFSGENDYAFRTYEKTGVLYPANNIPSGVTGASDTESFGLVLYWEPGEMDDLYNMNNGKHVSDGFTINDKEALWLEIGINLVAGQKDYEEDSFDNTYDLSAELPATLTFPTVEKTDIEGGKTLKVEKAGAMKSATIPAKGVETVFGELSDGYDEEDGYKNNMVLTLTVADGGKENETIDEDNTRYIQNLDIYMNARMTTKKNDELISSVEKDVKTFDEFLTIEMQLTDAIGADVLVKHKDVAMQKMTLATDIPTDTVNGGYHFDTATGLLTLRTKTLSPFSIEYIVNTAKYVASLVYWNDELGDYDEGHPELFKSLKACADKANQERENNWVRMYILDSVKLTEDVKVLFPDSADPDGNYSVRIWGTDKDIEIDLNGYTFTIAETFWMRGNVTFKNGNIIQDVPQCWYDGYGEWEMTYAPYIMEIANSGNLVIDNVLMKIDGEHIGCGIYISNYDYIADDSTGPSSCIIKDSTIYGDITAIEENCYCEVTNTNIYSSGGKYTSEEEDGTREAFTWVCGTLVVNSGEFISTRSIFSVTSGAKVYIHDGNFIANVGASKSSPMGIFSTYGNPDTVEVSGGTYELKGYPNSFNYQYEPWTVKIEMYPVKEGHKLQQLTENTWQVTEDK